MRHVLALVLCAIVLISCSKVNALEDAREKFSRTFPNTPVLEASETEIKGLYEIVTGSNILYYYPEKDLIIIGEIWTKDGKSITARRIADLSKKNLKSLPLEKAVRIGNGPKTVIEFSDPDCPFCRRLSEYFEKRTDVTRYVFFIPLPMHPDARTKALFVLSSKNPEKAYRDVMKGLYDGALPSFSPSEEAQSLLEEHITFAKKMGIQGTPTLWIDGERVNGADFGKIERLLSGSNTRDDERR